MAFEEVHFADAPTTRREDEGYHRHSNCAEVGNYLPQKEGIGSNDADKMKISETCIPLMASSWWNEL